MRGRKRKVRYSWLPNIGQEASSEILPAGETWSFQTASLFANDALARDMVVLSLTFDYPTEVEEGLGTVPSLADFQGSEYQLERTVGKVFARVRPGVIQSGASPHRQALLAFSIIILKVDEQTGAPLRTDLEEYTAVTAQNIYDPWMWRRTWVLGNDDYLTQSAIPIIRPVGVPGSTMQYGDIESGPFMDIRSVRRVRKEERVFAIAELIQLDNFLEPSKSTATDGIGVDLLFDYRMLGRLVKATAHGNTSR